MTFFKLLSVSFRPHSLTGLFPTSLSGCSASLSRLIARRPLRLLCATSGPLLAFAVPFFAAASATADPVIADPIQPPSRQKTISRPANVSLYLHASLSPGAKASTPTLSSASNSPTLGKIIKQGPSTTAHAPLLLTILTENIPTTVMEPATRTADAVSSQARFDFGSVSSLSPAQHVQTFFLRNDNKVPVTVSQLQSSSGCLRAAFAASEAQPVSSAISPISSLTKKTALHQLLPPGQQIPLHVILNSTALAPGAVDQSLWVFVEGQASPAATLKITGNLQPLLQFSPKVLDFGTVSSADKNALNKDSLTLTMTLDSQLVAGGTPPQIACSDPNIKVEPIFNAVTEPSVPLSANRPVVQTYRVQLSSHVTPGSLKSRLIFSFVPPAKAAASGSQMTASSPVASSSPVFPKDPSQEGVLVIVPVTGAITK